MSKSLRVAVAAYLVFLTVGVIAGQWVLQGPVLVGATANHGVHVGDLVVSLVTAIAIFPLLRGQRK